MTRGTKACANWLKYCLELGYKKEHLDVLEKVWNDYHDENGNLISSFCAETATAELPL